MISALLPYLQWKISKDKGDQAGLLITKWFKPAAWAHAIDTYWDSQDECVKNASNHMLDVANNDTDDLYWAVDVVVPTPKRKKAQADKDLLDDSVSMVKTVVRQKKKPKVSFKEPVQWPSSKSRLSKTKRDRHNHCDFSKSSNLPINGTSIANQNGK